MFDYNYGAPGLGPDVGTTEREWLLTSSASPSNSPPVYLPGGRVIDGTKARDTFNADGGTATPTVLRPGLPMGRITSSGKYANSLLGVVTVAYTSGGTSLTVSVATALEIVRRIGATGTFKTVGPPSSAGTVATITTTFSAVNTSTGVVTVTSLGANMISGAFIMPTDGSEVIKGGLDEFLVVTSPIGTEQDTRLAKLCVSGFAKSDQVIGWPTDTSLRTWLKAQFNDPTNGPGPFRFSDNF